MAKKKELWSTFRGNNNFPVYNWFYFTEAYSRGLVRNILLKFVKNENAKVLDPFCGTGTTLLVAKEFGYDADGFDVSPLMCLISKAKTNDYDVEKLDVELKEIISKANGLDVVVEKKWINKFFYSDNLKELYKLKECIFKLDNIDKDFFEGMLIKTLQVVTKSQKQGSSLKLRKINKMDAIKIFNRLSTECIKDLKKIDKKIKANNINITNKSILDANNDLKNYDAIITSPPYLNKTEYTRRMGLELEFLGFKSILEEHLGTKREFENCNWIYKKHFQDLNIQESQYKLENKNYDLDNYFKSLETFVSFVKDHLNKEGILAIVIAGGCFSNKSIDIYDYMQELYLSNGLDIIDIKIDREIQCHGSFRTDKTGKIKEFTIIGRKL